MLTDKLQTLDGIFRDRQASLYAAMQSGIEAPVKYDALRNWFSWKNGQAGGTARFGGALFFGWHRFIPFEESQREVRAARQGVWTNPIYAVFALTLGRQTLRSWPLLVDAQGCGYYFDAGKNTVLYRAEGDPDIYFDTFERYVDFLVELSSTSASNEIFLETEAKLLQRYAAEVV
jgi:hypothetical protein